MNWTYLFRVALFTLPLTSWLLFAQTRNSVSIQSTEYFEPLVPSAVNHDLAGFAFRLQDTEYPSGTPFAVSMSDKGPRLYTLKIEIGDSDGIVWSEKPNELYFSSGGIHFWHLDHAPRKLWGGVTVGLAISNDGRHLAFWSLDASEPDVDELVIFDVASNKELRRWKVKDRYPKDKHYYSLLFSPDGTVIYARTFEGEDTRPITAFEIDTGTKTTLSTDSRCLAATSDGTFYVEAQGPYYARHRAYRLFRVEGRSQSRLLRSDVPAAVCNGNRRGHLLVGGPQESKAVWVYDTAANKLMSFPTTCDNVAVFSDGSLVFARKNRLMWGKCK